MSYGNWYIPKVISYSVSTYHNHNDCMLPANCDYIRNMSRVGIFRFIEWLVNAGTYIFFFSLYDLCHYNSEVKRTYLGIYANLLLHEFDAMQAIKKDIS